MTNITTEKKDRICISLDKSVLAAVDAARGTFDRSSFINELLFYGLVADDETLEKYDSVLNG